MKVDIAKILRRTALPLLAALALPVGGAVAGQTLTNASYDPTRELYKALNSAFNAQLTKSGAEPVDFRMSHGGSGGQARAVIDGLQADVVTLALAGDVDAIAKAGLIQKDWIKRLPNNSSPYTSTIVFLVRKGNPKGIKDWDDLVKPGVQVITPNPKTSGGARWNYLAAWAYAAKKFDGDEAKVKAFMAQLLHNAPVLDSGARGSTTTFAQRGLGDVLLAWENETHLVKQEFGADNFEVVYPSLSILAEPPVAMVDANVDKHGTRKIAEAYLNFLYTPQAQAIIAANGYRPFKPEDAKPEDLAKFPTIELVTIDKDFGGWAKAQPEHFGDGGTFDQIYKPTN